MSNFANEHVSAATHFGGHGVDVAVRGKNETVQVSLAVDARGRVVMHKHVVSAHKRRRPV